MTKKNDKKPKNNNNKPKLILYEAVQNHPTPEYIIVGALASVGLLKQYEEEAQNYRITDITPSITMEELNKIIKEFTGE